MTCIPSSWVKISPAYLPSTPDKDILKLADTFVRRTLGPDADPRSNASRSRIGIQEGWVSVYTNFFLFVVKLIFGFISGSLSLMADAFHTLSDVVSSAVVIFGFRVSQKPADYEHPFGHGRAETIATLTIALLIAMVGFEFLKTAIERLFSPQPISSDWVTIIVIILTILVKEGLSRFSLALGDIIDSDTLRGDAMHHRSDAISSIMVVIALIGIQFHLDWLDGVMGIGVAGFMLYAGYDIARSAIDDLLGKPISRELIDELRKLATSIDGVSNVHDIVVHSYGNRRYISLHIEVNEKEELQSMHSIADQVEKTIEAATESEVVTHVDPVTLDGEIIHEIRSILDDTSGHLDGNCHVQDLRIVGANPVEAIIFELPVIPGMKVCDTYREEYRSALMKDFPDAQIIIELKQQVTIV